MKQFSAFSFFMLTVLVAALYLPMIYEKIFFDKIEKTHLFYSPVIRDFVFKEKIGGRVPRAVREKAECHHAEISYTKAGQGFISRVEFERLLPFIYYKNMEIWGLLPLEIDGRIFNKNTIKSNRRVIELNPRDIPGQSPRVPVWPLLESNPGQARLVFPDDRFRMTASAMEFINADSNRVDKELTRTFTNALVEKGFAFPVRSVNGKFTVLKPFDEGVFIVDANFNVFHVKRVNGKPRVVKTPIDPENRIRAIKISESRNRQFYGLVLGWDNRVHILSCENYQLIPLALEGYDPLTMDLKLIFNPLYCTAVYSDQTRIRALAMDREFSPVKRFSHIMSRASVFPARKIHDVLFPFTLHFDREKSGFLSLGIRFNGWTWLGGLVLCLLLYLGWSRLGRQKRPLAAKFILVALTGIYGMIAMGLMKE